MVLEVKNRKSFLQNKFLKDAPDDKHLLSKVILTYGLNGTCCKQELRNIKMEHIQDTRTSFIIDILDSKTKTRRSFIVPETFYITCQKYMYLRPAEMELPLFLNDRNGKCIKQVVGINTIRSISRKIAEYLELPESNIPAIVSAIMLVDAGGDMLSLKRFGGWQSFTVAEGYVNQSLENKNDYVLRISEAITNY
ncbi:uncharacterized protein LOC130452653 [Diorhabda sublineata]|uniref:uncharacterized protein LOC130452653 n=1 Tax=Diorhabda sublineata TaxID=1163346 RepID=UPI0024E18A75|nr:uncharacterized protein LOC130452653 [Diorhabda sublineata]